jgi:hypothetical protein
MEVGESIAVATAHEPGQNENCPFCPIEKGKQYKTYKGEKNDSETLEKIMVNPKD